MWCAERLCDRSTRTLSKLVDASLNVLVGNWFCFCISFNSNNATIRRHQGRHRCSRAACGKKTTTFKALYKLLGLPKVTLVKHTGHTCMHSPFPALTWVFALFNGKLELFFPFISKTNAGLLSRLFFYSLIFQRLPSLVIFELSL